MDFSTKDNYSLAGASDLQRNRISFINNYILICTVSLKDNADSISNGYCLVILKELRSQYEKTKNVMIKQDKIIDN